MIGVVDQLGKIKWKVRITLIRVAVTRALRCETLPCSHSLGLDIFLSDVHSP